jgi:hypothetical protein
MSTNTNQRRRALLALTAGALVALVVAASASTAGRDVRAPRIVAAALQDVDRDSLPDRLRLEYSERVRHARDADGRYPFLVAGQRLRGVGAASGRVLVLALVERTPGAKPAYVRYVRTKAKPVRDRAGNQATGQTFRRIRSTVTKQSPTPPPAPRPGDRDGDGTPDAQDCAPGDPRVEPGAPDVPDLDFVDANCDGIDGTESDAVFASPLGRDTNAGTKQAPKREIDAAVEAAKGKGKYVLAAAGGYERVKAASGVAIYGGYAPTDWSRRSNLVTSIIGSGEGLFAEKATGVVLQLLRIQGTTEQIKPTPGTSFYGIRAIDGSSLTLQRVTALARNGVPGAEGARGDNGMAGGNGADGRSGQCGGSEPGGGGAGGSSAAGRVGGPGGKGGKDTGGITGTGLKGGTGHAGMLGGAGGPAGDPGRDGVDGSPGNTGADGENGLGGGSLNTGTVAWAGRPGTDGRGATAGHGGGGGGGGGGQVCTFCNNGAGNGGGGGGGGGNGGKGGDGGRAGGGSIGIYLHDSTVIVTDSTVTASYGGDGGSGGSGGLQGRGGIGGAGSTYCKSEIGEGGDGGPGGSGGHGGGGGGGAGGPSVGIFKAGTSKATVSGTAISIGAPGSGGAGGRDSSGTAPSGPNGISGKVVPSS